MVIERNKFFVLFFMLIGIMIGIVSGMQIVYWGVTALIFIMCIRLGINEHRLLNPYFLFALTPLTLLCYVNISSRYMVDLSNNTWLIAILNMGGFVFALALSKEYKTKKRSPKKETTGIPTIVVLSLIGFVPKILSVFGGITIPLYSVLSLFGIVALVCAFKTQNKAVITIVMFFNIVTWFDNVTKSAVLTTCLCILIVYEHYFTLTPKQKRRLLILCLFGVVVMIYAFSFANQIRGNASSSETLQYFIEYGGVKWDMNSALFMPYMYLETPWTNLQHIMETQSNHTYGLWTIKPFLNYFQLDSLFSDYYELNAKSTFNTFTFIACEFKDFGMYGSVLISILLGAFVKWVYSRATITNDPLDVACYVYTAQAVLQMFFSNHFFQQSYPFTIVMGVGIIKMLMNHYSLKKVIK